MIRKLGTFVEFSVMREPVTVDWTIIGDTKELNIHGAHLSPYTYPIAIDMLSKGLLPMERIMTHDLPLSDFHAGMDMVAAGTESVKVTLTALAGAISVLVGATHWVALQREIGRDVRATCWHAHQRKTARMQGALWFAGNCYTPTNVGATHGVARRSQDYAL